MTAKTELFIANLVIATMIIFCRIVGVINCVYAANHIHDGNYVVAVIVILCAAFMFAMEIFDLPYGKWQIKHLVDGWVNRSK